MLRDDDTFVLTGVKSDIALFPLQLPRRTQTWLDRLMACPPKSVSRSKWLEMPFPFQAPSLARIVPSSLSFVRPFVRSLNPATSRINIPNNHAGRVTNAVPAPLAANWTRSGMLAQVLSKGPCTYDVCKIFGIFDPLPPPCLHLGPIHSTKFTQPPLLHLLLGYPPPPSHCRRHMYIPPYVNAE